MNINKRDRKAIEAENRTFPKKLARQEIPKDQMLPKGLLEVWRSRDYLLQVYAVRPGMVRLSVNRTVHTGYDWRDNIPWEDLQRLKAECGRGHLDAVEVYPREVDVVDVAAMRHLFVFEDKLLDFAWRDAGKDEATE